MQQEDLLKAYNDIKEGDTIEVYIMEEISRQRYFPILEHIFKNQEVKMETMEEIISVIQTYKEDHPEVVITDDMIKDLINDYMKKLIKEIKEEI